MSERGMWNNQPVKMKGCIVEDRSPTVDCFGVVVAACLRRRATSPRSSIAITISADFCPPVHSCLVPNHPTRITRHGFLALPAYHGLGEESIGRSKPETSSSPRQYLWLFIDRLDPTSIVFHRASPI
jgi:hypothetical protein